MSDPEQVEEKLEQIDFEQDSEGKAFENLMKTKVTRYWEEENPALKCHNCRQFGHLSKECPNETIRATCILCGKDSHDSFDCNEKMCFRCNKRGHQAN